MKRRIRYIVAKYNEDTEWVLKYQNTIYDKSKDYPNEGREAETYLRFIIDNYEHLEDDVDYVFCQGNPFDHQLDFENLVESRESSCMFGNEFMCGLNGAPHHKGLNITDAWNKLFAENPPITLVFFAGAMFKINKQDILFRSKEFYQRARQISLMKDGAWILERLWAYIFIYKTKERK